MPSTRLTRRPSFFPPFESLFSRDFPTMKNRLRSFFEEPFPRLLSEPFPADLLTEPLGFYPPVEASETADEYTMAAELPGLKPEDVTVECEDGVLTIRGSKEKEEKKTGDDRKYHLWERSYGAFLRSFTFPGPVNEEKIAAEFKNGVLTVHVPKTAEAKTHPKKIEIKKQ